MLFRASDRRRCIPAWIWMLLIGVPVAFMLRWLLWWFFCPTHERMSSVEIETPRSKPIPRPVQKDDFSIIKGIGQKTAEALYQAGIYSFEQMGLMDLEELVEVLKENSLPTGRADFWKQQAILAAAEDWKGLEALQK